MKNVPCRASPFSLPLTWLGTAAQLWMLVMLLEVTPWPFPCVGSPEQGCRRVRWALECELTLQTNESEEMGMKTPLGTCVNRRWGKEGLWPPRLCYSSSSLWPLAALPGMLPPLSDIWHRLLPAHLMSHFHRILHPYPWVFTSVSQQKPFTAESSDFHFFF